MIEPRRFSRIAIFALLKFLRGKHLQSNIAVEVLCSKLKIEGADFINVDGEIIEKKPFELYVVNGGLNFYLN